MKPSFRITANEQDITSVLATHLLEVTVTDESSAKADQLTIRLADPNGSIRVPPIDAQLDVHLGYDQDLTHKGTYTLAEVDIQGAPGTLTLRAKSADMASSLRTKKEQSWRETTLGDIVTTLASNNGLEAAIGQQLQGIEIYHLDQTNESDLAFFVRLGELYDAIATVKAGKLLFAKAGTGQATSGVSIPVQEIPIRSCTGYQYSLKKVQHSGVQANWNDTDESEKKSVIVGESDNPLVINRSFRDEEEAKHAADAQWARLQRGEQSLTMKLALGHPNLFPETPISAVGFKAEISEQRWVTTKVTHSVTNSGYTTSIELATLK